MLPINFRKAFTLVELLITVSIIGVLATITVGINARSQFERARDTQRQTDLEGIRSALEIYRSDNAGQYPPNLTDLTTPTAYLNSVPQDPTAGRAYFYNRPSTSTYVLCADMEVAGNAGGGNCGGSNCGGAVCDYQVVQP